MRRPTFAPPQTSPPSPLSLSGAGEEPSEQSEQRALADILGRNPCFANPSGVEHSRSLAVESLLFGIVVMTAIDLENEAQLCTIEVRDEAKDHLLPAKLQSEASTVPKKLPRQLFRWGRCPAHCASELDLPWIHRRATHHAPSSSRHGESSCHLIARCSQTPLS